MNSQGKNSSLYIYFSIGLLQNMKYLFQSNSIHLSHASAMIAEIDFQGWGTSSLNNHVKNYYMFYPSNFQTFCCAIIACEFFLDYNYKQTLYKFLVKFSRYSFYVYFFYYLCFWQKYKTLISA